MKEILKLLRPYRTIFILAILALIGSSFFNATITALVEPLMDNVFDISSADEPKVPSRTEKIFGFNEKMENLNIWLKDQGIDFMGLKDQATSSMTPLSWAILVLIVFLLQSIFDFVGTYSLGRIGISIVVSMRQELIEKIMAMSMRFFGTFNSGELLTRVNADVIRLQNAVSIKLGEMLKEATRCIIYGALAFVIDWKLSFTLFLLIPMVGIPVSIMTRKIRKYSIRSQNLLGQLSAHFKEVLVGMRIVKGFQKEGFEARRLAEINRQFFRWAKNELKVVALTRPIMGLIGMIFILGFVFYGSVQIQNGESTGGQFVLYILAVYNLYQPIKRMTRANSELQQAVGVIPRLQEILNWDNEIKEKTETQRFESYPRVEEITFDNVHFSYEGSEASVLNGVDLSVKKGSVVALVGSSGSGKSSLVQLLPRFYDVSDGAVRINGTDLRDMSKHDLRGLFAMVTQDTLLFDDTVFNNIAYGQPEASRESVEEAARQAFAHDFIMSLPEGYETVIGENGSSLSGGQRQRLSIARAIFKNAPILILDEATSALDTESEKEVQLALDNLMETKTTLVIAHRLSTIRGADEIVVLDKGRIVEQGHHQELMEHHGFYRRLIKMQEEGTHAP